MSSSWKKAEKGTLRVLRKMEPAPGIEFAVGNFSMFLTDMQARELANNILTIIPPTDAPREPISDVAKAALAVERAREKGNQ